MAESRRFDTHSPGCLEGLFNFLALNQKLQMPKMIAYRKHGDGHNNTLRVKVPKHKIRTDKDETIQKGTDSVSPTENVRMFIWKTLLFKKKTSRKDHKKSNSLVGSPSSSSSSRLTRTKSIHHSKCFDYVVPKELDSQSKEMNDLSSNGTGSCDSVLTLSHESPRGPVFQESYKNSCGTSGKDNLVVEVPCENIPENLSGENKAFSKQKSRDVATHHTKEFLDFLELFNAHRELFLKILHDPSLLVPHEQQEQEASSSVVEMNRSESFLRPGGSSGKRNPIFDRSGNEKSTALEIERSKSRSKGGIEDSKVITTKMPNGVEGTPISLTNSRSLKKSGTTSNHFKVISKKIKDVVKENRKEIARITKDGVFHKLPYGQKMVEFTKSSSINKFVQEKKQIQRSYSIAESMDKYSTLYESISRDSRISLERLSTMVGNGTNLKNKSSLMQFKRITSLPEIQLYSPRRVVLSEVSDFHVVPKTYSMEFDCVSTHRTDSFGICTEDNDDITEKATYIYREQNYGENSFLGSLEEDLRNILRSPSLSSCAQSFSHRRINSLPSFDRHFFQDRSVSFTEHLISDSEPTFEHMHLEDDDWLVKPPQPQGAYISNFKDDELLIKPLKQSYVNATDHEDEEWLVKMSQQPTNIAHFGDVEFSDGLNSEFQFIHEFSEQDDIGSLHIYVNDKNEADFKYVKDILKKSGFSCGEVDWYDVNQPVSPMIFEEAECSCHELNIVNDEPHNIVRRMLLFDLINKVLLDIYDSSMIIGPWHSRFDSHTRPIPMGSHVLEEVWSNVSRYLSLQWNVDRSVEDIVAHDIMRKDNWMNLVYDVEHVALDVEDLMVDDLLDDIVLQIVLISIDE